MGAKTGTKDTTGGSNNIFIGFEAGIKNQTHSNRLNIGNVIYGYLGTSTTDDVSRYTNPAPSDSEVRIYGKLKVCSDPNDFSTCAQVPTQSSKQYKKNIVPFKDDQTALEALLKTPLFNYQYKKEYPNKKRMGVIAEDLPKALQLPVKPGAPVQPDWVSIYGYLWAGIKALNKNLLDLSSLASKELEALKSLFKTEIQATGEDLKQELQKAQSEQQNLKKRFEALKKETQGLQLEIQEYHKLKFKLWSLKK